MPFRNIFCRRVYRLSPLEAYSHHGNVHWGRETCAWADFHFACYPRLQMRQSARIREPRHLRQRDCPTPDREIARLVDATQRRERARRDLPRLRRCRDSPPRSCCSVDRISSRSQEHLLHSFWRWRLSGDCRRAQSRHGDVRLFFVVGAVEAGATAFAGHEGWAAELRPACRAASRAEESL